MRRESAHLYVCTYRGQGSTPGVPPQVLPGARQESRVFRLHDGCLHRVWGWNSSLDVAVQALYQLSDLHSPKNWNLTEQRKTALFWLWPIQKNPALQWGMNIPAPALWRPAGGKPTQQSWVHLHLLFTIKSEAWRGSHWPSTWVCDNHCLQEQVTVDSLSNLKY